MSCVVVGPNLPVAAASCDPSRAPVSHVFPTRLEMDWAIPLAHGAGLLSNPCTVTAMLFLPWLIVPLGGALKVFVPTPGAAGAGGVCARAGAVTRTSRNARASGARASEIGGRWSLRRDMGLRQMCRDIRANARGTGEG